ncbi:hypothetical protein UCRPC4_g00990 [Phaeomoniella chlamydospora]|uniref:Uncharacterized protein n=1 Tax=Phaeomoniella chlamydospora TaxID=158046 RepID=A0A0G2GWF2_PHACM|nr:hypothetical protein UCRPC4_g00990 [Phaeomoniella chlamydospora]
MGNCISIRPRTRDAAASRHSRERERLLAGAIFWPVGTLPSQRERFQHTITFSGAPTKEVFTREQVTDRLNDLRTLINFSDAEIQDYLVVVECDKIAEQRVRFQLHLLQQRVAEMVNWVEARKIKTEHRRLLTDEIKSIETILWGTQELLCTIRRYREQGDHVDDANPSEETLQQKAQDVRDQLYRGQNELGKLQQTMISYSRQQQMIRHQDLHRVSFLANESPVRRTIRY